MLNIFCNPKKKYFKDMQTDANRVIWDLEFKKFTALNEREVIRKQYDQAQDALARINAVSLDGKTKEEVEAITNEKKVIEAHIANLKSDLDAVEATIVGGQPSEKLPNGAEGIDNKLKVWVERREYIKAFIQRYC